MTDIREKTVNTIRVLSADAVQKANSGHPGAPMGMAAMAYALWGNKLKINPKNPAWKDRDRFVLSSGHASAMLYSLLHLFGYDLSMEDLKQFRQLDSKTPGHPEYGLVPGVETTTGPLGQGVANAVGFAIAETMLAAHFNRENFPVFDHRTYAFCGDGCMMEGISSEAASLAGTLKLNKLTLLYDDNQISIEGDTDISFRENVPARFKAYGWSVIELKDANDYAQVLEALEMVEESDKPTLIVCPTTIGFGCPAKAGKPSAHGEPLGVDNLAETRKALGLAEAPFTVDEDVYAHCRELMEKNEKANADWDAMMEGYAAAYPELYAELGEWFSGEMPDSVALNEKLWEFSGKAATRNTSGEMLNRLAALMPNLVGGSADLAPSNKTNIKGGGDYSAENRAGRNMHFGVREHAMGAICNGMALHGGLRVYCGTFFVFSDYMKHAMRMAAIMKLPVIYILTHDSIGVGEDGMTHQPIEQLASLRATPNTLVFRPADGHETCAAYMAALTYRMPLAMALTRQNLPTYENSGCNAMRGGYILSDCEKEIPDVLLMASGSEVEQTLEAQAILKEKGIAARVISMPCMELFEMQSKEYKESVMPGAVRARVATEAGVTMPWYRYTGLDGAVIGLDRFGASAPAATLFKKFGFTGEHIAQVAQDLL